jgi:hypothetical protein
MKNFIKMTGLVLLAVLMLASCKEIVPSGGTIEVTNGLSCITYVTVTRGSLDILDTIKDAFDPNDATPIEAGKTKTFSFDDDGTYIILAFPPITGFTDWAILFGGITEKITVVE